jgi:hypothetical protein
MATSEADTQDLSRREREAMDIVYRLGRATALECARRWRSPDRRGGAHHARILVRKGG